MSRANAVRQRESQVTRAAAAAVWYRELRESSNEAFLPLYFDRHRYLVLMGGGGSGKSIFAGRKILERATTEPGHRFLVCRKVARTLRESCFRQLLGQIRDQYPEEAVKINHTDMRIRFANESEILFTGLDDVEKLKSIAAITGIWIEEASELAEQDFNQLDIRLRGYTPYYKQIILSFNPISALHWLKRRFFDTRDERAVTHHSTYRDNRFLDAENIRTLESFRESDPYYYDVYCLGMWGVTGRSVFPARAVQDRIQALETMPAGEMGYFVPDYGGMAIHEYRWMPDSAGYIRIIKPPEAGAPYVIGADTAGEGSDNNTAQVLDNRSGEQVAVLQCRTLAEDELARQLYCLGMYYNTALLAVETNWSTYPVLELERLRYPRQYVRESIDDYTHRIKHSFGFATNSKTRPVIIAGLIAAVREDIALVNDRHTLEEMLTFVRNEHFRAEAMEGAHDDLVMALAIAHYVRPQQRYTADTDNGRDRSHWTADMWEDWRGADESGRRYLERKWG